METFSSSEYPDDYIDIVNEINDFIASLDGVSTEDHHRIPHQGGNNTSKSSSSSVGIDYSVCGHGHPTGGGGSGGSSGSSDGGYGGSTVTTSRGASEFLVPHPYSTQTDSRFSLDSLEHDYEPIENVVIVLPPPTPPRNFASLLRRPTAVAHHCGGVRKMADGQPKHVKAVFNFKGTNNDELCFCKGDIVTVTQVVDGGWWEGTLNGKTGWFPSNYVKEVRADISLKSVKGADVPVYKRESMQLYHNVVLKNVIETERMHVSEMNKVLQNYFKPIQAKGILSQAEYSLLIGNLEDIISFQQSFLAALEDCEKLPLVQRRVGGLFMQYASQLKDLYLAYCANHPRAVAVLQNHREELRQLVESLGCPAPGSNQLTTYLSKPFTRLDRYPSLLKELERHIEESHPDRGDTQRAIAVYRDIANSCMEIRKLKEMEYEILTSSIRGWEGEEIRQLGEVTHLSQVKLHTQTGEKYERIFVLFSSSLVMLSMSPRLSSYQYEGKLPLSGMTVNRCEDVEKYPNGFEISGPMIEKLTVTCGTKMEVTSWLEVLKNMARQALNPVPVKPQSFQVSSSQPSISTITPAKTAQISHTMTLPPTPRPGPTSVWTLTCLRPAPPLRPTLMCRDNVMKSPRANRKSTQRRNPVRTYSGDETEWQRMTYNEDAFILQVIESYCNSVKTRHTVNSSVLNNPNFLIAEEEKIFDDTENQEEKTLVDTVYSLKDRVRQLEQEQKQLRQDLNEEHQARLRLEAILRTTSSSKFTVPAAAVNVAVDSFGRDHTPPT